MRFDYFAINYKNKQFVGGVCFGSKCHTRIMTYYLKRSTSGKGRGIILGAHFKLLDYSTFASKVNIGLTENSKFSTHERAEAPPQPVLVTKMMSRRFVSKLNNFESASQGLLQPTPNGIVEMH